MKTRQCGLSLLIPHISNPQIAGPNGHYLRQENKCRLIIESHVNAKEEIISNEDIAVSHTSWTNTNICNYLLVTFKRMGAKEKRRVIIMVECGSRRHIWSTIY